MNLSSSVARVAAGGHLIARHGGTVLLVCPAGPEHDPFVDQLLALCAGGGPGGPSVVRRAGALVTQNPPEAVPGFGILCQTADGVVALLAGEVTLTFATAGVVETLDGNDASTYVERVLRGQYDELRLAAEGAAEADPRSSLSDGVVRGAGVLLLPGSAVETLVGLPPVDTDELGGPEPVAESVAPAPVPVEHTTAVESRRAEAPFESISLIEEPLAEHAPSPSPMSAPSEEVVPDARPMVDGIYCSRSHFNAPQAIFCTACGISMVQQTHNRVRGPRPPLGVLVTDEGAVFSLVHDYVIGREPETAPEIVAGTALPIALDDPKVAMSRIHARILLDGWEVRVEDATSANGTFVGGHGEGDWTRLAPGVPTTIKAGTRIAVGGRTLTFETHQRS